MMQPEIKTLETKKLAGKQLQMSFVNNRIPELWRSFMPARKDITNSIGTELYSVEVYDPLFFDNVNPTATFSKWAAVEVTDFSDVPADIETLTIPGGLYAVFLYKGPASAGVQLYQYIYSTWIPASDYQLDHRPHFAVMGEKYKHEDPSSEEEIWIPIKLKES